MRYSAFLILAIVLVVVLFALAVPRAHGAGFQQEYLGPWEILSTPPTVKGPIYFDQDGNTTDMSKVDLDLAEVLDVMTDYTIRHDAIGILDLFGFYGYTSYDLKTIVISDSQDQAGRRLTAIHELLHVVYKRRGIDTPDTHGGPWVEFMHTRTSEIYQKLYGPK